MSSPESDVFIMSCSCEDLIIRMDSQTPQLSAMAKYDLIKSSLQGTLKNIVSRSSHINIPVISSRSLWIYTTDAAHHFARIGCHGDGDIGLNPQAQRSLVQQGHLAPDHPGFAQAGDAARALRGRKVHRLCQLSMAGRGIGLKMRKNAVIDPVHAPIVQHGRDQRKITAYRVGPNRATSS